MKNNNNTNTNIKNNGFDITYNNNENDNNIEFNDNFISDGDYKKIILIMKNIIIIVIK